MNLHFLSFLTFQRLEISKIWLILLCNVRDPGLIPGAGRSPGKGTGNLLQYSCLENSMERGDWWATVCGIARVGHDLATQPQPS